MHVSSALIALVFLLIASPLECLASGPPSSARSAHAGMRHLASTDLHAPPLKAGQSQAEQMLLDPKASRSPSSEPARAKWNPAIVSACSIGDSHDLDSLPRGDEGCASAGNGGFASRAGAAVRIPLGH